MSVGSLSAAQLARQRFALLCDAQQHGGLFMQEFAPGDYFICVRVDQPGGDGSVAIPIAKVVTTQTE